LKHLPVPGCKPHLVKKFETNRVIYIGQIKNLTERRYLKYLQVTNGNCHKEYFITPELVFSRLELHDTIADYYNSNLEIIQ
jgi:hypothetical protein